MDSGVADKKQMLLERAIEIYARRGDITVRELAAAADMNIASVNYYFGSKQALLACVEQNLYDKFNRIALSVDTDVGTPHTWLSELLSALVGFFSENPGALIHFYGLLGLDSNKNDHNRYNLYARVVDPENPYIRLCSHAIAIETGIADRTELFNRYILFICSLIPPFLIGMLDPNIKTRLSRIFSPPEAPLPAIFNERDWLDSFIKTTVRMILKK